ncbi:universal stress protein [Bdellovibrio sp.]|uniref:universal stress protein n=1 Tax=Bdellovibrio sp. TaxID=28201 RepID=UPI0039E264FC
MSTRSILVADELDKTDEQSKKRSAMVQRLGSDLSVLLECPTDLVFVHRLNEILGKKILNGDNRKKIIDSDRQKYATVLRNFQRPGELFLKLGWPIEEIVKLVTKEHRFEGLVLGTRSLQGVERFFLGSVAEEVVRSIKRPTFILGPGAQKEDFNLSEHKKRHFLVVTDLTKKCRAVETYAVSLAQKTGASVTFYYSLAETLSTAQQFAYASGEALSTFDSIFEDMKNEALTSMTKKIDRLKKKGLDCKFHIEAEKSDLIEAALSYASDNTQLIFMGHQSHGFIASTVLGSNLRGMIAKAKVPVVVVRS